MKEGSLTYDELGRLTYAIAMLKGASDDLTRAAMRDAEPDGSPVRKHVAKARETLVKLVELLSPLDKDEEDGA